MSNFYMMVGLPGSGKTTVAKQMQAENPNSVWISSDDIRKELFGSEEAQQDANKVFEMMFQRTQQALKENKDVYYDATNLVRKRRIALLKQLYAPVRKICVFVYAAYETCVERNISRDRHVPEYVIKRMVKSFQTPHCNEGFDELILVKNDLCNAALPNLNIPHDNPHHPGTIQEHINRVVDLAIQRHGVCSAYHMIAKYHDCGKAFVKDFKDSKGNPSEAAHYYDHQNAGAYFIFGLEELQHLPNGTLFELSWYVNMHMEPFFNESKYFKSLNEVQKTILYNFNRLDREGA